jgi:hypothetical protein
MASYLNPSIREFIGSVICEDADTPEDLLKSAVRFSQVKHLWDLSMAQPNSALADFLASDINLQAQAFVRLLHGPAVRWDKTSSGMRGFYIDMEQEARIGFLFDLAGTRESAELFSIASKALDYLIDTWERAVPDFSAARQLLKKLAGNRWVAANGGRPLSRKLIDALLSHLTFASASDWMHLIALPKEALEWSAADQANLDRELKDYCDNGVTDDRHNRSSSDELTDLRDSLEELGKKVNYDFSSHIHRLDEAIAERSEEPESLSQGSGILKRVAANQRKVVTDDEVKRMFETLISEYPGQD